MKIAPCNTYAARPACTALWRDGPSAFKIYYVDIYGRDHPERFEWALNPLGFDAVPTALTAMDLQGVGFVVAFPHIAKVFRYAPASEILVFVKAFKPTDGSGIDLERGDGYVEFACLAEAVIAADEYKLWAAAPSVESYLGEWVTWGDLPILDHGKLGRYWGS